MFQEFFGQTPFPNLRTPGPQLHTPLPPQKQMVEPEGVIYGTTIQVPKVMALIQRFILEFEISRKVEDEYVSERIYRIKLNDLPDDESVIFEVEGRHLREFDRELYLQFIYYPAEMISIFDMVLKNLFGRYFVEPETIDSEKTVKEIRQAAIMVGIKGLHEDDILCVRELGPNNIGKLVMIRAIVIRMSEVFPQMKRAWFRCENCYDQVAVPLSNAKVQQPEVCRVCMRKQTMQIIHNFCSFTDKQYIKIQELPELVTEGETPSSLTVISYDTNVDGVRPGDRVQLIGIYRAQPAKLDRFKGTVRTVFNTYLDLISFNVISQDRYSIQKKTVFTDNQTLAFRRFADNENVVQNLVKSFAPSIFGHDNVKLGVLAQLFGGHKKNLPNRGSTRADINVCLVGDPSTAKSQLLQQVHRIAPRSVYTSGRGSSAVGLTASVRKDPDSGEFILQSGALVLADQGICCIDQFDKMQENSRTILLQAMQQQTISIAKAGIVCQLNSRTAILAAANPIGSKYDNRRSIVQNINLPPSIVSRFDLIYILLDLANEATDTKLATHILDFYVHNNTKKMLQGPLSLKQLTRYITYARESVAPILTEAAGEKLRREYCSIRAKGISTKTITATPRQLQSLIRISEAFAKMRLSKEADENDVERALQLIEAATLSTATNLETGILDIDIIVTGRSSMAKKKIEETAHKMREFLLANESKYRKQSTLEKFLADFNSFQNNRKLDIHHQEMQQAIKLLQADELLVVFGPNKNNPYFKLQVNSEM